MKQQLFAGIDWATKTHAVCVVDADGGIRARFEVSNTGKTFTGLVKRLVRLAVAGVAIERPGRSRRCAPATGPLAPSPTLATPTCSPTLCAPTGTG